MSGREGAVWITGVGLATPLGLTYPTLADNLLEGRSGVRRVTHFDPVDQPCLVAATLGAIPCPDGWDTAHAPSRQNRFSCRPCGRGCTLSRLPSPALLTAS